MKRDLSAAILIGYIGCSIAFALASPFVPIAIPWLENLPTVETLVRHGVAKSDVLAYFSLMWCLLPIMFVAMMIWSPAPTKIALESNVDRLLLVSVSALLLTPLFIWILCFFAPNASGGRVKLMLYLSAHSKVALGVIYGGAFDGLLILMFGVFFALPRLWILRMKNPT